MASAILALASGRRGRRLGVVLAPALADVDLPLDHSLARHATA